ncbi:hypothetical protein BOTBODRAFT_362433 [Botryobasidium botryosum FD-172 SS1]|uniref:Uncharacterized protein n=1 Tax=Botryobasidium botryosum (strain FD-172 SS1) TaxID=930990 RepID=A0A067MDP0_BOTB1|nr:hypothetical protein BOTBODRAFT_362433 [Botryobasidium botryosum FD-172 SS1]
MSVLEKKEMNDRYLPPSNSSPLLHPPTEFRSTQGGMFQPPQWSILARHVASCAVAGPGIYITVWSVTKYEVSIDMFRAVVNVITTLFGTLLGITLTAIAVRHLQAGAWATIAEAQGGDNSVTVNELDGFATGGLLVAPWSLLKRRFTKDRMHSRYPWTLNIFIFLLLITLSKGVFFLLERTITITSYTAQQPNRTFYNTSVVGDLSPQDVSQALQLFDYGPDDVCYCLTSYISDQSFTVSCRIHISTAGSQLLLLVSYGHPPYSAHIRTIPCSSARCSLDNFFPKRKAQELSTRAKGELRLITRQM